MKLSHPVAIRFTSLLLSWAIPTWLSTQNYGVATDDEHCVPRRMKQRGIYVFWHEMLLFGAYANARGFTILSSRHRDGELIAQTIRRLGGRVVRGSTNKQGAQALRQLMRQGKISHLALTPDGPRGPRRVVKPGAIYIASRVGMPIIPVGFAFQKCWRAGSWDRMALPRPGQQARVVLGRPLHVPPGATRIELEGWNARLQGALDNVQSRAEAWAGGGAARGKVLKWSMLTESPGRRFEKPVFIEDDD